MNRIRKIWGQARGPVAMFLTLFAFWLLISGAVDSQHLIAGALSAALITWYWRHLVRGFVLRRDVLPYRVIFNPRALPFMVFMLAQIFKSNIAVAMVVLNPRLPISPAVITTRTDLKRNLTRVMLAQSITLTPGTVTLDLKRDHLVIHSLTESAGDFSHLDAIETRLAKIERGLS